MSFFPYRDPNHHLNGKEYHTGELCRKCRKRPAGNAWSDTLCWQCNADRIDGLERRLQEIANKWKPKEKKQ